jgi:mRNA interferase RelE/StbE
VAYKILIKSPAAKDLDRLPVLEVKRLLSHIKKLTDDPRPIGIQKLTNEEGYRIRSGKYRILFEINDRSQTIFIYRIKHRKEVYRK